jgi:hypothetical protein
LLRRTFGDRFLGGFSHTDYAVRNYNALLLVNKSDSSQVNYLRLMNRHAVCVATTGLHGSIGWKMGEYVPFSNAIVSERLNSEVPGDFKPGTNFLEFTNPEECVDAVDTLRSNADLRLAMMKPNSLYYLNLFAARSANKRTLDLAPAIKCVAAG